MNTISWLEQAIKEYKKNDLSLAEQSIKVALIEIEAEKKIIEICNSKN